MQGAVFLCGFMGCGKTTIGAALAERLGVPLIDTDARIVEQQGRSIPEIFAQDGEAGFRAIEAQTVRSLCAESAVIACGGGALLNPETAAYCRAHGVVLWLDVPFDVCYDRIKDDENRPLVQQNGYEGLRQLYARRAPLYEAHSTHRVQADVPPEAAAQAIQRLLTAAV